MARKRFNPAERDAFTPGMPVEWLNGAHWKPGTVTGAIAKDSIGSAYVPVRNDGETTRTVSKGAEIWGTPGRVRLPA